MNKIISKSIEALSSLNALRCAGHVSEPNTQSRRHGGLWWAKPPKTEI